MGGSRSDIIRTLVNDCEKARNSLEGEGSFRLRVLLDMILMESKQNLETPTTAPQPDTPSGSAWPFRRFRPGP